MKYQMIGSVLDIKYSFVDTRVSELGMLHSSFGSRNLASHRATQAVCISYSVVGTTCSCLYWVFDFLALVTIIRPATSRLDLKTFELSVLR